MSAAASQVKALRANVRHAVAIGIGVARSRARTRDTPPSCRASPGRAARRSASARAARRAVRRSHLRARRGRSGRSTIGASCHPASLQLRQQIRAKSGGACRWTASADRPSLTMIARSGFAAARASSFKRLLDARSPAAAQGRAAADKVSRSAAALSTMTVSTPSAAISAASASASNSLCTASRAAAWADLNSSHSRVGKLPPARPKRNAGRRRGTQSTARRRR